MNKNYRNNLKPKEFLSCIASELRTKVIDDLKNSPFLGLQADESTDAAFHSQLSLAGQYISGI